MSGKRVGGVYRGVVAAGVDPSALGRIRVSIPALTGTDTLWAFPCLPRPMERFPQPRAGQGVWIAFENEDVSYPIIIGFYGVTSEPDRRH